MTRYTEAQSKRVKAGIARASRSDTRFDWSTTLGANYTYRLLVPTYNVLVALSTRYVFAIPFTGGLVRFFGVP